MLKKNNARKIETSFLVTREPLKRISLGFVALLGFRYLLPLVGFGPSTFLFIFTLSKFLGHHSWKASLFFAVLAAFGAYFLFQGWLDIQMPRGVFGI